MAAQPQEEPPRDPPLMHHLADKRLGLLLVLLLERLD